MWGKGQLDKQNYIILNVLHNQLSFSPWFTLRSRLMYEADLVAFLLLLLPTKWSLYLQNSAATYKVEPLLTK